METREIFNRFWIPYSTQNPSAMHIYELFTNLGERVVHDHIALRTFNDPRINMDVIARIFTDNGYEQKGNYEFKAKKVLGRHYEHKTDPEAPKVFISELLLEQCSEFVQNTIRERLDAIDKAIYKDPMLVYQGSIWGKIPFETYDALRQENEYAAWTLVYGFRANHFAIKVNELKKFSTLQEINQFVKDNGYLMNVVGGSEIYGTPEELLEQSSTKAEIIPFEFSDGVFEVPSCFYEFTLRHPDKTGKLYSGFIAANADKIFESTNFYQKQPGM
ncbi:MAG: DUF1338 domain-containing protein [Bacteroidales bacterium]|nr:DUF1338 domain-containing protein [Bacteroidales bacterium]